MPESFITTDAIILREVKYKEADRILTIFSRDYGKMTVKASNALRKTSKYGAGTQMLMYSDLVLYNNKGRYLVREAVIKEEFAKLREDFSNYALACYFAECLEMSFADNSPDVSALRLILNCLYVLSNQLATQEVVKASFEIRLMSLIGYLPDMSSCIVCGNENPINPVLGTECGHLCCRECRNVSVGATEYLDRSSLAAFRHIIKASNKSFIPEIDGPDSIRKLEKASEAFFMCHMERCPSTLDYWKKIK